MWKLFIHAIVAIVIYIVAMLWAENYAINKLGARSGLFGAGLVTMFTGFIWSKQLEMSFLIEGYWDNGDGTLPVLYYILFYSFFVMGLAGIAMVAVDLLMVVKESKAKLDAVKEKVFAPSGEETVYEKMPAWKRVQEETEKQ
jgi:hypothetical protein